MKKTTLLILIVVSAIFISATVLTTINDFFLPGSQIGQSGNIESPDKCDNCHGGYDQAVEPAFNWRGSMMAQAARDPLFYACLAIANQDVAEVGDLCLRCHTPDGWLNGRCVPTDGSALNNNDRQGVQCDFCHKLVKPTPLGVNPFPGNTAYTSTAFGSGTYTQDQSYLGQIIPIPGTSTNGMYIADANNAKRGPFTDAVGRHQMLYSPFHSQSDICGTCHDVSNPAFTRTSTSDTAYTLNTLGVQSPTFDLRLMFPVERTYSEWLASGFSTPGTTNYTTCQDCHMRDVTGKGAKMRDAPVRTNLPLHDFTGGNTFAPLLIKQLYPSEINPDALDAGILRARNNLQNAATMEMTIAGNIATVKVINNTGHKLPTGYPEGRRMWINIKAYDANNNLIYESGAYNNTTAVLTHDADVKIYECEPGNDLGPSFHFALNNKVWKDNRIPPAGFTNALLNQYQSPVIGASYPDGQNWDITTYTLPTGTEKVESKLYYQTISKEFVEFLRDENTTNTKGQELYNLWAANGKSTPELMQSVTWPVTVPTMTAEITSVTRIQQANKYYGQAVVSVTSNNLPLSGANVTVSYTGPNSGTDSGVTNANGEVTLNSSSIKNPSGIWCFTITNVTKTGYLYVPNTAQICEGGTLKTMILNSTANTETAITAYPNPFAEKISFSFATDKDSKALIEIYDLDGKKVCTLFNNDIVSDKIYVIEYSPVNVSAGILLYKAMINGKVYYGKLIYSGH